MCLTFKILSLVLKISLLGLRLLLYKSFHQFKCSFLHFLCSDYSCKRIGSNSDRNLQSGKKPHPLDLYQSFAIISLQILIPSDSYYLNLPLRLVATKQGPSVYLQFILQNLVINSDSRTSNNNSNKSYSKMCTYRKTIQILI